MACLAIHPPSLGKCTMVKIVFSRMYHHKKLVASISCVFFWPPSLDVPQAWGCGCWAADLEPMGLSQDILMLLNHPICYSFYVSCGYFMVSLGNFHFETNPHSLRSGCVYTQFASFSLGSSWWSSMKLSFSMALPSFFLYFQTTFLSTFTVEKKNRIHHSAAAHGQVQNSMQTRQFVAFHNTCGGWTQLPESKKSMALSRDGAHGGHGKKPCLATLATQNWGRWWKITHL